MKYSFSRDLIHKWDDVNHAELKRLVPTGIASRYHIVPIEFDDQCLMIAVSTPRSGPEIKTIERKLLYPVKPILIPFVWFQTLFFRLYHDEDLNLPRLPLHKAIQHLTRSQDHLEILSSLLINQPGLVTKADNVEKKGLNRQKWGEIFGLHYYLPHLETSRFLPSQDLNNLLYSELNLSKKLFALWWYEDQLIIGIQNPSDVDNYVLYQSLRDVELRKVLVHPDTIQQIKKKTKKTKSILTSVQEDKIVEQLVDDGLIPLEDYVAALTLKEKLGISLYEILGGMDQNIQPHWLKVKAALLNLIPIYQDEIPDQFLQALGDLFAIVPLSICKKLSILPLNLVDKYLIVGVSDFDPNVIALIEGMTGRLVEPRLMSPNVIDDWLNAYWEANHQFADDVSGATILKSFLLSSQILDPDIINALPIDDKDDVIGLLNYLVDGEIISETDLMQIYGLLFELPILSLTQFHFDQKLIDCFSPEWIRKNQVLPLFSHKTDLWVAVNQPYNGQPLLELSNSRHQHVWPVLVPESMLRATIDRMVAFEPETPNQEIVSEVLGFLVDQGVITRVDEMRLLKLSTQNNKPIDLLVQDVDRLSEAQLTPLLAASRQIPYIDLDLYQDTKQIVDPLGNRVTRKIWRDPIDQETANLLDYQTANQLMALPFAQDDVGVKVAFCDPIFDSALDALSEKIQFPLVPHLVSRKSLEAAIKRSLGQRNLGTSLLLDGVISRNQLNQSLNFAQKMNIRIGRALIHLGYLSEEKLYEYLAKQSNWPLFRLSNLTLDREAAELLSSDQERYWGVLPLSVSKETVILGVVDPLNQEAIDFVETTTNLKAEPVLISESDFEVALESLYQENYLTRSISELLERSPDESAFKVLSKNQIIFLIVILFLSLLGALWRFNAFMIIVNAIVTGFYLIYSLFKFYLVGHAIGNNLEVPVSNADLDALQDHELPMYTILIPAYKEAEVLPNLLHSVELLDYPKVKLDVIVLLEADDHETIERFNQINPPEYIRALIVPTAQPKTKPKACNYGLIHAKGYYTVIFDAEDRPEQDQLKQIVAAFKQVPDHVVCIQAKLNYFNRNQNILTNWFTSEYSMWFDLFLPGLDSIRAPIPLGGTSNHFLTSALVEVGGWDPYNVTEDADLGIRLYKRGYRTRIVDTTTYEEANSEINNWIRQRSRWIKGYIQTWLVHMRHPVRLIKEIGIVPFLYFQLVVGGTFFTVLANPIYWIMTTLWLLFSWQQIQMLFPPVVFYMGAICLFVGNFAFTYVNVAGAIRRNYFDMVRPAWLSPVYWGLMSIGAWKGFIQLIRKPHFWEKTIHGLDSQSQEHE